jgi:hypothetical protein
MIFEPALLPDFGRASRRHLRASLTCYAHFFHRGHITHGSLEKNCGRQYNQQRLSAGGKYLNQLYWMKVRSWEFYLATFSLVGEADFHQAEKWILCQFEGVVGHRKVKLDLSIADQKLSCKHCLLNTLAHPPLCVQTRLQPPQLSLARPSASLSCRPSHQLGQIRHSPTTPTLVSGCNSPLAQIPPQLPAVGRTGRSR